MESDAFTGQYSAINISKYVQGIGLD